MVEGGCEPPCALHAARDIRGEHDEGAAETLGTSGRVPGDVWAHRGVGMDCRAFWSTGAHSAGYCGGGEFVFAGLGGLDAIICPQIILE